MNDSQIKGMIKLIRPHQYIKNTFIFVGILFSHKWEISIIIQAWILFIAFCSSASAVYIFNDIIDLEADRAHPQKKNRPLASGLIPISTAKIIMILLAGSAIILANFISLIATIIIIVYMLINIAYSMRFKHIVILDVFIISFGFMLRILAGTVGLSIVPSEWLLLCGFMLTLFLGFCKRTAEIFQSQQLISQKNNNPSVTRKVLNDYAPALLEQLTAVTAACTIISFALYTVSPKTINIHGTDNLIYTLPIVVYGIFRYLYLLHHQEKGSDTAKDLLTDRHMLLTALTWITLTLILLL